MICHDEEVYGDLGLVPLVPGLVHVAARLVQAGPLYQVERVEHFAEADCVGCWRLV